MKRFTTWGVKGLALVLLIFMAAGCDTIGDLFENDKETSGVIVDIQGSTLSLDDGFDYTVTDKTEYEGVDGLAGLAIGNEVEIEYKENGGVREALEVELAGAPDDD